MVYMVCLSKRLDLNILHELHSLQKYQKSLAGFQKQKGREPSSELGDFEITKDKVKAANDKYQGLKSDCESLLDRLQVAQDRQKQFEQAKDKLEGWLNTAEGKIKDMKAEPIKTDPNQVQEQLEQVKSFNAEAIQQSRQVEGGDQGSQSPR